MQSQKSKSFEHTEKRDPKQQQKTIAKISGPAEWEDKLSQGAKEHAIRALGRSALSVDCPTITHCLSECLQDCVTDQDLAKLGAYIKSLGLPDKDLEFLRVSYKRAKARMESQRG